MTKRFVKSDLGDEQPWTAREDAAALRRYGLRGLDRLFDDEEDAKQYAATQEKGRRSFTITVVTER